MSWVKLLWTLVTALYRGWLTSEPSRRSLSAAATPPGQEIDPCADPFGDNLNAKTLAFNQALADLKWAAGQYLACRQEHGLAQVSIEQVDAKFASIEALRDEVLGIV